LTANNGWLYSVSCAATDFCVATDIYGEAVMYNGVSWTASSQAGPGRVSAVLLELPVAHVLCGHRRRRQRRRAGELSHGVVTVQK
jgi:hypothetical protein